MSICTKSNNTFSDLYSMEKQTSSSIEAFHQTPGDRKEADISLTSCTESLGSESSDEMISSFNFNSDFENSSNNNRNSKESCQSSYNSPLMSRCYASSVGTMRRNSKENKGGSEKRRFPPPLTSLSENGRRNFTLKSVRKDGRLEIFETMIERPEILCASRLNGRLRMHFVQTEFEGIEDDDEDETVEEEEEKERDEWKLVKGAGLRRCYDLRETRGWGEQHRYVTTV